jgi:hypothetical protein
MKPTHMMVLGATQTGKTTYAKDLHRRFRAISVFVDTKGIDTVWGVPIRNLGAPLPVLQGKKLVWRPPRGPSGIDWPEATAQLRQFWGRIQAVSKRAGWTSDRPPFIQLLLDEAQRWEANSDPGLLEDMSACGLGMGLRLVYITQHPAGLSTETRNNLETRIVFRLGDEGRRCIQGWSWPADAIAAHTQRQFCFASNDPALSWRYHEPIAPGSGAP